MRSPVIFLYAAVFLMCSCFSVDSLAQEGPRLVIRSDDMGFSHGSNVANEQLLASGLTFNISVLFAAPWHQESVEILKRYPDVSIGVHLCANSEWQGYKWGPVANRNQVPSLVNDEGYFFGSYRELNVENDPKVEELETEFRAQIERALATGLRIDYLDNHMGAGMRTEEQRAMVEKLAEDYDLALSGSYEEQGIGRFQGGDLEQQLDKLVEGIGRMHPDSLYRIVLHVGTDTPELQAMQDTNEDGVANMSRQREIKRDLLLSEELREALKRKNVKLTTYRQLH